MVVAEAVEEHLLMVAVEATVEHLLMVAAEAVVEHLLPMVVAEDIRLPVVVVEELIPVADHRVTVLLLVTMLLRVTILLRYIIINNRQWRFHR